MSRKQKLLLVLGAVLYLAAHELTYIEETSDGTDKSRYATYRTY